MESSSSVRLDYMESSNAGEQKSLISSFLDIAAGQSVETARKYLQATDWKLDQAITLFYGQEEVSDDSDPFKKVTSSNGTPNTMAEMEEGPIERRPGLGYSQDIGGLSKNQRKKKEKEDFYRGFLDRAYDPQYRAYLNSMRCRDRRLSMRGSYGRPFPDCGYGYDRSSFFDCGYGYEIMPPSPERKEVSEPKVDKVDEPQDSFDSLYRPPKELMHKGALHDAKQAAEDQDKWLIVNVQSEKEFSSQTLNLDVWANEMVAQTIGANFIFWQVYDDTTEGKKECDYYNLKSFPAVLVLDPITRHMMRSWTKKIEAERLLEDLVPFMDASPKQHHAQFGPPAVTSPQTAISETTKEDEEVKASSKESMTATTIAPTCSDKCKKLTYPDLPEEPKVDEDETLLCRIEVHFPNGRRLQRNFLRTDPIQFLWSFCSSQLDEAESRPFQLTQAIGGASDVLDYESRQTFKEAGLLDSMISVTWE
ncbi:plant UBX domain-containing protein 16-like [Papaver somniferum]|uniref:plant UBX domain-containing protein 16-like n=1 Tax=Papaver somniferum TaxID=3469 RepID=UPI000E70088F|nr:plant UBX domain-containing protein 16-like [Papaver somniferum]